MKTEFILRATLSKTEQTAEIRNKAILRVTNPSHKSLKNILIDPRLCSRMKKKRGLIADLPTGVGIRKIKNRLTAMGGFLIDKMLKSDSINFV